MFNIAELIIFISSQPKFLPGVPDFFFSQPRVTLKGLSAGM